MAGDDVAGLAVDDVVEARLGAALVAQSLEEEQGIGDAPARVGLDADVLLIARRHLVGVAVPFQPALFENVGLLGKRRLEVQAGLGNRLAHGFTELGDDDLFGFRDRVKGRRQGNNG